MALVPPTAEREKTMRCELHQCSQVTLLDVQQLQQWLAKQSHLPKHMDAVRLERFLYGCKYSVDRTKMMLERYYTVRANITQFFANRDPFNKQLQDCFQHVRYFVLPSVTAEGYRVTCLSFNTNNVTLFNLPAIVKRIVMTLDARLLMEKCLNNVMVIDLKNITMAHCLQCLPTNSIARKGMMCIQDAFPMRLATIHFLNAPPAIDKVIRLFAPLLKPKLMQKFVFHAEGGETLQKYMPKEILPIEYGGSAGTIDQINEYWQTTVESLRGWFIEEERFSKADETRRIKDKRTNNHSGLLTGISGSFRQLSID